MDRKLYLSDMDKKIGGVCGGLGEFFNIDSTLIRLLWIIASLMFTAGIGGLLIYVVAWAIIPSRAKF